MKRLNKFAVPVLGTLSIVLAVSAISNGALANQPKLSAVELQEKLGLMAKQCTDLNLAADKAYENLNKIDVLQNEIFQPLINSLAKEMRQHTDANAFLDAYAEAEATRSRSSIRYALMLIDEPLFAKLKRLLMTRYAVVYDLEKGVPLKRSHIYDWDCGVGQNVDLLMGQVQSVRATTAEARSLIARTLFPFTKSKTEQRSCTVRIEEAMQRMAAVDDLKFVELAIEQLSIDNKVRRESYNRDSMFGSLVYDIGREPSKYNNELIQRFRSFAIQSAAAVDRRSQDIAKIDQLSEARTNFWKESEDRSNRAFALRTELSEILEYEQSGKYGDVMRSHPCY